MARKTEKGGKFRSVHCRIWNMVRKLKIMENEKQPLDHLKNDEITDKRKNKKCTLQDQDYGKKTKKKKTWKMRHKHYRTWNLAKNTENF